MAMPIVVARRIVMIIAVKRSVDRIIAAQNIAARLHSLDAVPTIAARRRNSAVARRLVAVLLLNSAADQLRSLVVDQAAFDSLAALRKGIVPAKASVRRRAAMMIVVLMVTAVRKGAVKIAGPKVVVQWVHRRAVM